MHLDKFTTGYITCMLWHENGGAIDGLYGIDDISDELIAEIIAECEAFQRENGPRLEKFYSYFPNTAHKQEQAGHDFWLARNRFSAGFWCRSRGEVEFTLTYLAQQFGPVTLYIDDTDEKIHSVI